MLFSSYGFLFAFLPVVLAGTYLLAIRGAESAQFWLIGASLAFYAAWNVLYLPLLLASVGANFLIARGMQRAGDSPRRTWLLAAAVAGDLALLGYYKYMGFFVETLDGVAGTGLRWASVILPLGISFYTFQQITLLVDVAGGKVDTFRFRDFLLFVTFFPHLIAGPIVHHREMMPQFESADWRARGDNIAVGVALLATGLFKKTVLADGIAVHVTPVFANAAAGEPVSFLFAWVGAIGFTLQMYFDFSGYSEMALGLARMLGIRLPMNFNSPLKAVSLIDYWSRWHITLTRFLTAYVYNPIALRRARARLAAGKSGMAGPRTTWGAFAGIVALPTGLTMFLSGLWHGAGNQFLVFGLIHGAGLIVNHAWRLARPRIWRDTAAYQRRTWPLAWFFTFVTAMVALTFFHADSVTSGGDIVAGLFGLHGIVVPDPVANLWPGVTAALGHLGITFGGGGLGELVSATTWIVPLLLIALVPPNTLEIMRDYAPAVTMPGENTAGRIDLWPKSLRGSLRWSISPRWAAVTAALTSAGILGLGRVSEFLYWQF